MADALVSVKHLKKYFPAGKGCLKAVDDVSFEIRPQETFGLVGESGCGKSTIGRTLVKLYEPTEGEILFDGKDITKFDKSGRKAYTREVQMIFQDPYASLDGRMTVGDIIGEGLDTHFKLSATDRQQAIYDALAKVGLSKEHASRFTTSFPAASASASASPGAL
jgi:oligopeptide transport system ATP-binding protein